MMTHVTIENFKCHEKTELDLGRLTLLVGPNSSGKSSALEAIEALCKLTEDRHINVFKKERTLESVMRRSSRRVSLTMEVDDPEGSSEKGIFGFSAAFDIETDIKGTSLVNETRLQKPSLEWSWDRDAKKSSNNPDNVPEVYRISPGRAQLMKLDARKLAEPRYSAQSPCQMAEDGEGLANVVAELAGARDERLTAVEAALLRLVRSVERIKTRRKQIFLPSPGVGDVAPYMGDELLFDFVGARDIPAHLVSEGNLIALGILVLAHREPGRSLFLLDDLEHALHFEAQRELMEILKNLLDASPGLQIVATTHSPYLLDAVDAKDIWVMDVDERGVTACCRLWDHSSAEKTLEVLMPGELYTHLGSKWVTERRDG